MSCLIESPFSSMASGISPADFCLISKLETTKSVSVSRLKNPRTPLTVANGVISIALYPSLML